MKIISYNINGIRAAIKKKFINWLEDINPDIICLQEIKATPQQFDSKQFESIGYKCFWYPAEKKGYSGVAILSKKKPEKIIYGCGEKIFDDEGRVLIAKYKNINVLSCYFPSGTSGSSRQLYKMNFLKVFYKFIDENFKGQNCVISGDFNICHKAIDIHNPVSNKNTSGFLPEERDWMSGFLRLGFVDTFREKNLSPHQYSWWSYRANSRLKNKGWRIDYHMLSKVLTNKINEAKILQDVHHSDHCPILLDLNI